MCISFFLLEGIFILYVHLLEMVTAVFVICVYTKMMPFSGFTVFLSGFASSLLNMISLTTWTFWWNDCTT